MIIKLFQPTGHKKTKEQKKLQKKEEEDEEEKEEEEDEATTVTVIPPVSYLQSSGPEDKQEGVDYLIKENDIFFKKKYKSRTSRILGIL